MFPHGARTVGYNLVAVETMDLRNAIDDEVRAAPSPKRADLLRLIEPPDLSADGGDA